MQALLVHAIVASATLYIAWRFMPAPLRARLAARIGALARAHGLDAVRAARLQTRLSRKAGCGSCDACNACANAKNARASALASEIEVPEAEPRERRA